MVKMLIISVACIWLATCLGVFLFQERMIFQPTAEVDGDPQRLGLAFEDIYLSTRDGETLHGWYVVKPGATSTVLFFHGNAGNISDRPRTLSYLHELGLNVFMIDYRGYGRSSGRPSAAGTIIDAETAWDYLVHARIITPETIAIYGRSLGGAVAIALAAKTNACALIVESSFTSIAALASSSYPRLPTSVLLRHDYQSLATFSHLTCPC